MRTHRKAAVARCGSDFEILPDAVLLYTVSCLDRVNIGQAKIAGLMEDLKVRVAPIHSPFRFARLELPVQQLTSQQFNVALVVFFVTYLLAEIPSNLGAFYHRYYCPGPCYTHLRVEQPSEPLAHGYGSLAL